MSKKILSVVLALVFVVSTFAVSAFAVGDIALDPEASTKTQTWALSEPAGEGPYTVDVSLTANYKVGAIQFKVANADENALLTGVALNAAVFGADWEDNYDVDFTDDGLVLIVPTPANASKQGPDLTAGAVIVTLTYELAEGKTSAEIAIKNDPKNADNIGGSLIAVRMSDDSLTTGTLYYGQTVTSVGETRTLGSAAAEPADLALTETGSSAGIIIDTNKTFGGTYAGVVYGVASATAARQNTNDYANLWEATNGGSLAYTKSPYAGRTVRYGTGTVITVNNADGTESKKYVLVIFGDMNGDAVLSNLDIGSIYTAALNNTTSDEILRLAANVKDPGRASGQTAANILYNVTGEDTGISYTETLTAGTVKQASLATHHNKYNYYYQ